MDAEHPARRISVRPGLALIFDLDGVIVDSMPVHTEAWKVYLEREGIPGDDLERRMHGRRNDDIVLDFFGDALAPADVAQHGARKEQLFREMMQAQLEQRLAPGLREFLDRQAAAPMAIATNAERANVDFVVDGALLRGHFKVIVDGAQVKRPKPYPDVYLLAADQLDVDPKNCIVFEDSAVGVAAAHAAGARVVGVESHVPLDGVDFHVQDFRDSQLETWLCAQHPVE